MDPTSIPPTPMLDSDLPPTARPMLQAAEAAGAASQGSTPSRVDPLKPNSGMQVRGPSDIEQLEEEEERRREQEDGRWWMDWMCGCKESGGRGHGQVCRFWPGFMAPDPLPVLCRLAEPTRSSDSRDIPETFPETFPATSTYSYRSHSTTRFLYLRIYVSQHSSPALVSIFVLNSPFRSAPRSSTVSLLRSKSRCEAQVKDERGQIQPYG
jgi:hypothetical protein